MPYFHEQWQIRKKAAVSAAGMVSAQHCLAAEAGADMLKQGGNAIDAALACAFALNAVEPWMSGLGGSGYAVIWRAADKTAHSINFQGCVPQQIDLAHYPLDNSVPTSLMGFPGVKDNHNVMGYGSISVPGAVAGLSLLSQRFGRLGFDQVLTPAIDLAAQGLPVDWHAVLHITLQQHELIQDRGAADVFLPNGYAPELGTYLPLPALTQTLSRLAEHGPEDFYRGQLAEQICADLAQGSSAINQDDLAAYRTELTSANSGQHRQAQLFGADNSSGFQRLLDTLSYADTHLPTTRQAPDEKTFLVYAQGLNEAFKRHFQRTGMYDESGCTTHLSAVDSEGNMVSLTYTLLNRFGSQVVLPSTGIVMNNAISYFDPRPDRPTSLSGGKRINSSNMCPIISVRDEQAHFALGASGANFIVPAVTQICALLLDYEMSLEQAFHWPRVNVGADSNIAVDSAMPAEFCQALEQAFNVEYAPLLVFPKMYACPSGVMRNGDSYYGMSDPSSPVAAAVGL